MATSSTPAFLKPADTDTSTRPTDNAAQPAEKQPSRGMPRWLLFAGLGILLAAGAAGGFFFLRHGSAVKQGKAAPSASASNAKTAAPEPAPTIELPLDPFVVNLADAGGHSYARIGLTFALSAPAKAEKKEGAAEPGPRDMLRDTVIAVLNREQSADLLAPDGKEHLKQAIRAAVAARSPRLNVVDIYFTEFLVQP